MKIGIIVSTDDAEACWNALRYANFCLGQKDEVKVFLSGKGVEYQKVSTAQFNTVDQAEKFLNLGGRLYACGTCLKARGQKESQMCPLSSLKDMDQIVRESDRVLTF